MGNGARFVQVLIILSAVLGLLVVQSARPRPGVLTNRSAA